MSGGEAGGFSPGPGDDQGVPWIIGLALVVSGLLVIGGLVYGLVAAVRWLLP